MFLLLQDCLVKQGMYTQYAESALRNVADVVNSVLHDIIVAKNTIIALTPQIETRGRLHALCFFQSHLSHFAIDIIIIFF